MRETYTSFIANAGTAKVLFLLLFVLAVFYLPGSFCRDPLQPDEVRNLLVARDISSLREAVLLRYGDEIYYQKPPLYFWLLKALLKATGKVTLPVIISANVVIAWGLLSWLFLFLKGVVGRERAFLSVFILLGIPLFYGITVIVRMDILFAFFICGALMAFFRGGQTGRASFFVLSVMMSFLAVFTKGAYGILIPLLTQLSYAVLERDRRLFGTALAVNGAALLLIGGWLGGVTLFLDPAYGRTMIMDQTISRAIAPVDHPQGFWYYVPYFLGLYLPWALFFFGYLFSLKGRQTSLWERFLLCWFTVTFVVLTATSSKLFLYLHLVAVPVACLGAYFLAEKTMERFKTVSTFVIMGLLLAGSAGAAVYFWYHRISVWGVVPALLLAVVFARFRKTPKAFEKTGLLILAILILFQAANFIYLPYASHRKSLRPLARYLDDQGLARERIYVYHKILIALRLYMPDADIRFFEDRFREIDDPRYLLITREDPDPAWRLTQVGHYGKYTIWRRGPAK